MKQTKEKKEALAISACHEVQIHYKRPLFDTGRKIDSSETANTILRDFIDINRIDHKEFFWVILLTNANQVIGISEIGAGCTKGVTVNTKEVCQLALLTNAASVVVAHNHPSGKLNPSVCDHKMTAKIKDILNIIDVILLDHLIITSEAFTSFADNKWM
tara:strand:- start:137823 stop:138299 length:477 start_codon:yes stop_codon:yes gene_type:complete